ncbi:MAG: hypothetical protein J1F33_04190 [Clostridiales bacterium]|nr:hypothetical protein [Clostridiales bacterium]
MIFISSDAFNNPNSPVYYIVGVVFLLLIAALLAGYLLLSKYLEKKKKDKPEVKPDNNDVPVEDEKPTVTADEQVAEEPKDGNT